MQTFLTAGGTNLLGGNIAGSLELGLSTLTGAHSLQNKGWLK